MGLTAFGSLGSTIKVSSGEYFDFLLPDPALMTLRNIARPLSRICRFGGHIPEFYSVAEHCVRATDAAQSRGCTDDQQLAILMHDAAEAFCGDCVKPLKVLLGQSYSDVESRIENAIAIAFSIDFKKHDAVIKKFDQAMLIAEKRHFFREDDTKWYGEDDVLNLRLSIRPWNSREAEIMFTNRFVELWRQ